MLRLLRSTVILNLLFVKWPNLQIKLYHCCVGTGQNIIWVHYFWWFQASPGGVHYRKGGTTVYTNIKLSCYMPEANAMCYVNVATIEQKKTELSDGS